MKKKTAHRMARSSNKHGFSSSKNSYFILFACLISLVVGYFVLNVGNIAEDTLPSVVGLLAIALSLSLFLFKK